MGGSPSSACEAYDSTLFRYNAKNIVKYMDEHRDDLNIQLQCFENLTKAAGHKSASYDEVVVVQGVRAITEAMRSHWQNAQIQDHACRVLHSMASGPNAKDYCPGIASAGGIELVLRAMGHHLHKPCVQEHACAVLLCLAGSSPEVREMIVTLGGIEAIGVTMEQHPQKVKLQKCCCLILKKLSEHSLQLRKGVAASGAAEVLPAFRGKLHAESRVLLEKITSRTRGRGRSIGRSVDSICADGSESCSSEGTNVSEESKRSRSRGR